MESTPNSKIVFVKTPPRTSSPIPSSIGKVSGMDGLFESEILGRGRMTGSRTPSNGSRYDDTMAA
jgi:hypothetical protein